MNKIFSTSDSPTTDSSQTDSESSQTDSFFGSTQIYIAVGVGAGALVLACVGIILFVCICLCCRGDKGSKVDKNCVDVCMCVCLVIFVILASPLLLVGFVVGVAFIITCGVFILIIALLLGCINSDAGCGC